VQKRLGLIALLGVGVLLVISAAIKTYKLSKSLHPHTGSIVEQAYELYAWTSAVIFILYFCACIPTYKPIWDNHMARRKKT
jgi:uncharacterized BrkB/YihY/UPF0761 family membrane protein